MLTIKFESAFKRDYKRIVKRGYNIKLLETVIHDSDVTDQMSDDLSWAAGVAQVGMVLKESEYAGTTDLKEVKERLKGLAGDDEFREEFLYMMTKIEQ